jgi:hypothetical protein
MKTIVKAVIAEFNRQGLLSKAMKPLVVALFVVCGLASLPATASATDYDCTRTSWGVVSTSPQYAYYSAGSDSAAVGACQSTVNDLAIALCEGQGTIAPFYIEYTVRKFNPWATTIAYQVVAWQCVDGGAEYYYGEG